MLIHPISLHQLSSLAPMAKEIWYEYYLKIISQDQIDYMLEKFYQEEVLINDFQKGVRFFYLGNPENPNGFLAISEQIPGEFFIHKFYLYQRNRGKGLGSKVFSELIQQFPDAQKIRLQVNRLNFASINFYFKNGFKIERVADFQIGNGFEMNDFILIWNRI